MGPVVRCTCVYCHSGEPHPHGVERSIPLIGNPLVSVCRNCGHKAIHIVPNEETD